MYSLILIMILRRIVPTFEALKHLLISNNIEIKFEKYIYTFYRPFCKDRLSKINFIFRFNFLSLKIRFFPFTESKWWGWGSMVVGSISRGVGWRVFKREKKKHVRKQILHWFNSSTTYNKKLFFKNSVVLGN